MKVGDPEAIGMRRALRDGMMVGTIASAFFLARADLPLDSTAGAYRPARPASAKCPCMGL